MGRSSQSAPLESWIYYRVLLDASRRVLAGTDSTHASAVAQGVEVAAGEGEGNMQII